MQSVDKVVKMAVAFEGIVVQEHVRFRHPIEVLTCGREVDIGDVVVFEIYLQVTSLKRYVRFLKQKNFFKLLW